MPAGSRITANNVYGTIDDSPLTAGSTTLNSTELSLLPAVVAAHAVLVLDPKRVSGEPEIVIVTAHTGSATVATITRGAYGTVARSHNAGTPWAHVPVIDDYERIVTSSTRPSDPYEGQTIWETDTDALQVYTGVSWREYNRATHAFKAVNNAAQALAVGPATVVNFQVESFDFQNNFASNVYTVPINGLYWFNTWCTYMVTATGDSRHILHITVNGSSVATDDQSERGVPQNTDVMGRHISALLSLTAGDLVRVAFQPVVIAVSIFSGLAVFEGYRVGAAQ